MDRSKFCTYNTHITVLNLRLQKVHENIHKEKMIYILDFWNNLSTKLDRIKCTTFKWDNSNLYKKKRENHYKSTKNRILEANSWIFHVKRKNPTPISESCGSQLTVKHILTKCQLYYQERINFIMIETLDGSFGSNPNQNEKIFTILKLPNLRNNI